MRTADEVLAYWFGAPATTEAEIMTQVRRWFSGGDMDAEVRERFGETVEAALAGELDGWADEPRGRLALVILLDQLTRNTLRDDPAMYAGDGKAQRLALDAFDRGLDARLAWVERLFLSMPLLHSEDPGLLRRAGEIARAMAAEAQPPYDRMSAMHLEQTAKYLGIVERFGRFPHRNAILGRTSTAEEEDFMRTWAERGPPRGGRG